ncbi:TlpA family protein disulfide reductase [Mucilaginibacter myungsuensis]|uniref:TlpA family protein disulfide reductase n=1 Tax=Mucilaginibacter myungsuensis TaxID=649104 RepID=A0A929PY53_9SPHI|nr:TlpA disulfide reductase family protein [Mucilaginibacter myungsuensis]MBE9663095.1 TlpA family protein disulfide reductase [Mucilaginibacter myungsuensis]MDN3598730.1 TlpA disulfide reductase family protein [Mucilaginibacter myungsuensis]
MKKMILNSVLATLCLFSSASAQDSPNSPLTIGDRLPDLTITNVQHYKTPTLKLSAFKGKAIIIDFWATWCAPCVKMVPKMDSLQTKYADQLQFISVSTQPAATVNAFYKRIEQQQKFQITVPSVTDDRALSALFPYQYLPHYVWINKKGIVTNFSSFEQVDDETIAAYLKGINPEQKEMPEVTEVIYDKSKPLFLGGNGGEPNKLFAHSFLSDYMPGLEVGTTVKVDSINGIKISARNQSISQLMETAYGNGMKFMGEHNVIYEVKDKIKLTTELYGQPYLNWLQSGVGYCYELHFPPALIDSAYHRMRQDMELYFPQYQARVEKRATKCLVLKRTSGIEKFKSKGGGASVEIDPVHVKIRNSFLFQLTMQMGMRNADLTVVDGTGYQGRVDLDIDAALNNIDAINKELAKYDLRFEQEERKADFLIIRDHPAAVTNTIKGGTR